MNDKLDQLILSSMPNFIAVKYRAMLDTENFEEKTRIALQMYELALREITMAAVSQYLEIDRDHVSDESLNQLLISKLQFATLDTWQEILFAFLRAYEGKRSLFFVPELYDMYWDSESVPSKPVPDIEKPFRRLTQIHNDLISKNDTDGIQDYIYWRNLFSETITHVNAIIEKFQFFADYTLIRVLDKKTNGIYLYEEHKGEEILIKELAFTESLEPGHFYLSKDNKAFLSLHPLLIHWEGEDKTLSGYIEESKGVAIYERFISDRLYYLLAGIWKLVADQQSVTDFVRMIYLGIEQFKAETIRAEQLSWWQLQTICKSITARRMAGVLEKYHSELYLARNETLTAFKDFLASEKKCFVLTGKSGVGKSNFLLALSDNPRSYQSDICYLMYNGAKLNPQHSLTSIISAEFDNYISFKGSDRNNVNNVWKEIAKIDGVDSCLFVLCIDAINENPEARSLLAQIDELAEAAPWPWLKIVITSRPEAWRTIKRGLSLAEALYYRKSGEHDLIGVEMKPFAYSEEMVSFSATELSLAYEKYRSVYQLKTAFEDLPTEVKIALRDPLTLRLIADIYQKRELPPTIRTSEIYRAYIDHLIKSGRLEISDLRFLENTVVPLMISESHYANRITAQEIETTITSTGIQLYDLIHNDGLLSSGKRVNQAYVNLVDSEILSRLGEGGDYELSFKFERFYDYYAGKRLYQLASKHIDRRGFYLHAIEFTQSLPFLWGGVKIALLLEIQNGEEQLILSLCLTKVQVVKEMLTAVLNEFGEDNPTIVHSLLVKLLHASIESLNYLQRLLWWTNAEPNTLVLNAAKIAVEVAGHLGDIEVLIGAADSRSATIRTHTVREIVHLWRQDRDVNLKSLEENRGLQALKGIGRKVRPGIFPNVNAVEAGAGIMLPIFGESYVDINSGREPELERVLQELARKALKDIFYVTEEEVSTSLLRSRIRNWVVTGLISFAGKWINDSEHSTTSSSNIAPFMKLAPAQKYLLIEVLPYIWPGGKDINNLNSLLEQLLTTNDTLITFALWFGLIAEWQEYKSEILDFCITTFVKGTKDVETPPYAATMPVGVLTDVLRLGESDPEVFRHLAEWIDILLTQYNGRMLYSGGVYAKCMFTDYLQACFAATGKVDLEFLKKHTRLAVERTDVGLLKHIIVDLGGLISDSNYHMAILLTDVTQQQAE